MKLIKQHGSLLLSLLLLIIAMLVVFPYYQYNVDPDATAYLTIAKRYVAGDYAKAINGYWSPWSIWLTAVLMSWNIAEFTAAIMVNTVGAMGFLCISYSLLYLFRLKTWTRAVLSLALVIFLVYAIFWQSFDDLWQCFFLLAALRIFLLDNFTTRPTLWIVVGLLGAFAYFAKAYSFPFFILNTLCCTYYLTKTSDRYSRRSWLKITFICIVTMIICSSPWIYLLYTKYGKLSTGSAGSLNMSWYLVGHPFFKEGIIHLLPPVYPDSPSYWEDPYFANGDTPHFWNSFKLFLLQGVRIVYNLLKLTQSITEISAFFAVTAVLAIAVGIKKNVRLLFDNRLFIVSLSFLLFPLGYILVNFQARYLWYMLPLSMLLGALAIQKLLPNEQKGSFLQKGLVALFALSFLVTPILGLKSMYRGGQKEYEMAQWMKREGINGSFTTNIPYSPKTQDIVRLSYFSGNPYYNMPRPTPQAELLKEMRRYKVKYYFRFHETDDVQCQLLDESGRPFPEVTGGRLKGLSIYLVNNQ